MQPAAREPQGGARPRRIGRRLAGIVAVSFAALVASPLWAVTVSPTALYIDARTRSGSLTLYNGGTLAEEIEIAFQFGYPVSDSLGQISIPLVDVAPAGEPSLVPWLQAFPRRIRLEPGQVQTVRILVQPPAGGIPEGEYWGRILVKAQGGEPPIEQRQGDIQMQISMQTILVTAVTYRNGAVKTGVTVKGAVALRGQDTVARMAPDSSIVQTVENSVDLLLDLEREGNAAFLGHVHAELLDPSGRVVGQTDNDFAVYRSMRIRTAIPLERPLTSAAGYRIRYEIDTKRPDLPPEGPLSAPTRSGTVALSDAGS